MSSPFVGPIFEILAGPHHTSFLAHASILEKSETLRAVVQGKWKDSIEHKIVLEDWDPQTISRLLEWLYTGDYESPFPAKTSQPQTEVMKIEIPKISMSSIPDVKKIAPCTFDFGNGGKKFGTTPKESESAKGSKRPPTPLANIYFKKADPEIVTFRSEAFKQWAAKFTETPCDLNFEATLLAHAKLYALADYMLLPTLQAQAFQRLKDLLGFISAKVYTPPSHPGVLVFRDPAVVDDILTLVRYVYANTTGLESEEEPLRKLVSTFVAQNYDQFEDDKGEVLKLMGQGGDFPGDLHNKVRRNELALNEEVKALEEKMRRNERVKKEEIEALESKVWRNEVGFSEYVKALEKELVKAKTTIQELQKGKTRPF
ncbi:hypothetical protein IMSHALPRED_010136 [Imshaugia aleurites]|uniref:BTB domain-containing protein n=1 Tax=Imshaugia aleurites TaxID=172621 RepID=A0A8H3FZK8_9LECA|nr:hypothetical protein IMSHALPRED_010136 [Imshaugia aleurites]